MDEGGRDQGRKHQEVKTTIEDFFPLKKRFVLEAFENLDPRNNSDDVKKAEAQETLLLGKTNPYALISFGNLLESYTETVAAQVRRGNIICHQALRLGVNGKLPKFREEFVQEYDEDQDKRVEEELNRQQLQPHQGALPKRQENVARFREFEPAISKIVERKLRTGSKHWLPEQDNIYSGFMDLYFLFREGCSDPKNFQPTPNQKY